MAGITQPQPFQTLAPGMPAGSALNIAIADGKRNYQDAITALAGGAASGSVQLALGINKVTTVGTAGDSAQLPPSGSSLGGFVLVNNRSGTSMQIFASQVSSLASGALDTVNGAAGATGVTLATANTALFMCTAAGAWFGPVALA